MKKMSFVLLVLIVFSTSLFFGFDNVYGHTGDRRTYSTFPSCVDSSDGDFICDSYEAPAGSPNVHMVINAVATSPYEYVCGSGTPDPICPMQGTKDLMVEIDCLAGQCPDPQAVQLVKDSFWNNGNNIRLHVQIDEPLVATDHYSGSGTTAWPGTNSAPGFDQIKRMHFGTPTERDLDGNGVDDPSWINDRWKNKHQVFHYVLFVSKQTADPTSSGISEVYGNDVMISLGNWAGGVGSVQEQAGTLMHEIGHNLKLNHGGQDTTNCKPNYISVMSHSRQMVDLVPTRQVDYSALAIGPNPAGATVTLNEGTTSNPLLDESKGIDSYLSVRPSEQQVVFGPTTPILTLTGSPTVDWDRDGDNVPNMVSRNINDLPGCGGTGTTLTGYVDWGSNLKFDFKSHPNSADGVSSTDSPTLCSNVKDNFDASDRCVREVDEGVGSANSGNEWTIVDSEGTMVIKLIGDGGLAKEDTVAQRNLRVNALEDLLTGMQGPFITDNAMNVFNGYLTEAKDTITEENDDAHKKTTLYKASRAVHKIKSASSNLIESDENLSKIIDAVNSLKMSYRLSSHFVPNDNHEAPFSDGSARQQEALGYLPTEFQCHGSNAVELVRDVDGAYACVSDEGAKTLKGLGWSDPTLE